LLLPQDTEETAFTLNGRKRRLTQHDFEQFGAALGLTGKQIKNACNRFRARLPAAREVLRSGYCSADTKQRFEVLMEDRARRVDL